MEQSDKNLDCVAEIYKEIELLDRLLYNLNKVLDSAQPNLEGKLTIRFWQTHTADKMLNPVIISRSRLKEKYPRKVQEKYLSGKALSKGKFFRNYESTKELLKLASELLTYRKKLKEVLTIVEKRARQTLNGNYGKLMGIESLVIRLDTDVRRRLVEDNLEDYHQELGKPIFKDNLKVIVFR